MASMRSAVLLLDPGRSQSVRAAMYAREFFDVRQVQSHIRTETKLREECCQADWLLNFLSAPHVPLEVSEKFKGAINFHPAPPEYPGVGSASMALYDRRTTHGVTAHLMDDRFDHGMILRVRRFPIDPSWGYQSLFNQALEECLGLFIDVCSDIAAGRPLRKYQGGWDRAAITRKEFEAHPSFSAIAP
jgi:methionyl-tRNA formyltransferase